VRLDIHDGDDDDDPENANDDMLLNRASKNKDGYMGMLVVE
jgi:hypothetical protein